MSEDHPDAKTKTSILLETIVVLGVMSLAVPMQRTRATPVSGVARIGGSIEARIVRFVERSGLPLASDACGTGGETEQAEGARRGDDARLDTDTEVRLVRVSVDREIEEEVVPVH